MHRNYLTEWLRGSGVSVWTAQLPEWVLRKVLHWRLTFYCTWIKNNDCLQRVGMKDLSAQPRACRLTLIQTQTPCSLSQPPQLVG